MKHCYHIVVWTLYFIIFEQENHRNDSLTSLYITENRKGITNIYSLSHTCYIVYNDRENKERSN
jgi:hypothetical protein